MATGYSFAAMAELLYPMYKSTLQTQDLNTLSGPANFGTYFQGANSNATLARNYPEASAGCLEVLPNAGGAQGVVQRYTVYTGNNTTYVRSNYAGTWSVWKRYISDISVIASVYPIGICVMFYSSVDPNTAFPGTTWVQITDQRQVRAAETASAIGTTAGSDSAVLTAANLPEHTHSIATHSHSIETHSHTMAQHSHTVNSHSHGMGHGHTASAASNGAHSHYVANGTTQTGTGDSITLTSANYLCGAFGPTGFGFTEYALKGNATVPDRGNTSSAGAHAHTITVASHTGSTGASAPGTSTAGATATGTGGPTVTGTGGPTETGVGPGTATEISTAGAWRKYGLWRRTA